MLHYKFTSQSFETCQGLRNRVPQMYFALQVITSIAKDDEGREKRKRKKEDNSQIVTFLWGKRNYLKYSLSQMIGQQLSVNNNLKYVGDKKKDLLLLVFYTFLKLSTKGPFIFFSPLPFICLFIEKLCGYSHIQQCANVSGKALRLSVAIYKTNWQLEVSVLI